MKHLHAVVRKTPDVYSLAMLANCPLLFVHFMCHLIISIDTAGSLRASLVAFVLV